MSNSLRTMTEWAMKTHAASASSSDYQQQYTRLTTSNATADRQERARLNDNHKGRTAFRGTFPDATGFEDHMIQGVARSLYDSHAPTDRSPAKSRDELLGHIMTLESMNRTGKAEVYPQGKRGTTPLEHLTDKGIRKASTHFAHRIMPTDDRAWGSSARVTMNFRPQDSTQVAQAMADEMSANQSVTQSKMMGPANIGTRGDDAILYMKSHDFSEATRTANSMGQRVSREAFVDHAPFGMEPIPRQRGFSYSEALPHLSSSHGTARKGIISAAVRGFRELGGHRDQDAANMEGHVGYQALKAGFNPNAPAFAVSDARRNMLTDIRDPRTHQAFRDHNTDRRVAKMVGMSASSAKSFRETLVANIGR